MIPQVDDLRAEAAELHRLLAGLGDSDWPRATQFKAWTIDDIVRHLHMGDTMALASASDPADFARLMADIQAPPQGRAQRASRRRGSGWTASAGGPCSNAGARRSNGCAACSPSSLPMRA